MNRDLDESARDLCESTQDLYDSPEMFMNQPEIFYEISTNRPEIFAITNDQYIYRLIIRLIWIIFC
jgi:hypothetical protein